MAWCGDFIQNELGNSWTDRSTATVVQFSGIKALEASYEPDNDGSAFADDSFPELMHYRVEHGPSAVSSSHNPEKSILKNLFTNEFRLLMLTHVMMLLINSEVLTHWMATHRSSLLSKI